MNPTHATIIVAVLATLAVSKAAAEPLFASPPHLVADGDHHSIVLFLSEPVSGALTARGPDGTFEVRVPRSAVAPAIQGQDFGADGWGDSGAAVRHLVLAAGAQGDTHIRLEPGIPVGGVDTHFADDPPRLVIELLAPAPTRRPGPIPTRSPRRAAAPARSVGPSGVPTVTASKAAVHTEPMAIATPRPGATAAMRPVTDPIPTVTSAAAPMASSAGGMARVPVVPKIPGSMDTPVGLGCLWRRVSGAAICLADPKAAAYAGDRTVTLMLGTLARGKSPEPEDKPAVDTPAMVFIEADQAFVTRAPQAKFLPVVDAYRRALRLHPDFPEAWRARLNIALAYRAMEFRAEISTSAGETAGDPSAGLVRGLAGDVAFVSGQLPAAADEYRRAAQAGGVGPCLAARGRARVALAQGEREAAASEVAGLGSLCPLELMTDPETVWVRGRLALANYDATTARALLTEAQGGLGKQDQGAVIADLGAVAAAAGDTKAERASYEQLLGGAYGARAVRQATVRLALLDGVGGDVAAGLKRLEPLTPEASDPARRALVMQAARTALAQGHASEAIAMLQETHVDPGLLSLDEQLLVAHAYRDLGLASEAERVLETAQAKAGRNPSDALFAERGALALERHDGAQGVAIADEWIRAHGQHGGALALRARAVAVGGDGIGAQAAVAAAVIEDPSLARTLALEVAEALHEREPAAALVLAREALAPGPTPELPAERAAVGLALVGALAEAVGDDETALTAFTTLTARYGKEPVAADAAYRAARLAAQRAPGSAATAYDEAARSKDALSRRMAEAARDYEAIVRPLAAATSGSKAQP